MNVQNKHYLVNNLKEMVQLRLRNENYLVILLKKNNIRRLKEEEPRQSEFNLWTSKEFK